MERQKRSYKDDNKCCPITFSMESEMAAFVSAAAGTQRISGSMLVRGLVNAFLTNQDIESECLRMEDDVPELRPVAYSLPMPVVTEFRLRMRVIQNANMSNVLRRLVRMYQSNPRMFLAYLQDVGAIL